MELNTDHDVENLLESAATTLQPDRTRFESVFSASRARGPIRSPLSLMSLQFIMNQTSKVLVGVFVVVVVAGGLYLAGSRKAAPGAEESAVMEENQGTPSDSQTVVPLPPTSSQPATNVADAVTAIDASLGADLNNQTMAMNALDASADQSVSAIDTSNSQLQPYDANSI